MPTTAKSRAPLCPPPTIAGETPDAFEDLLEALGSDCRETGAARIRRLWLPAVSGDKAAIGYIEPRLGPDAMTINTRMDFRLVYWSLLLIERLVAPARVECERGITRAGEIEEAPDRGQAKRNIIPAEARVSRPSTC